MYGYTKGLFEVGHSMEIHQSDVGRVTPPNNKQEHMLVYCGEELRLPKDVNTEFKLVQIFPIDKLVSPSNNSTFDLIKIQAKIIQESYTTCEMLNSQLPESMWAFCDLSTSCYIILSNENVLKKDFVALSETHSYDSNIQETINESIAQLEKTLEEENDILAHNKNHSEYRQLIEKCYKLQIGVPERQYEGLSLAWLLLNTERSETALRNLRETGDINNCEAFGQSYIRDVRFLDLKANIESFLTQATSLNDQSQIWATLYFTMHLLEILMQDKYYSEEFDDFLGLYPIIEDNEPQKEPLRSIAPIQYSPLFSYAFLFIPSHFKYQFHGYVLQLLHEFFHYVPTNTRKKRNETLIHMFACFVLREHASEDNVNLLSDFLIYHYKRFETDSLLYHDSMSFISTMRFVLNRVNILDFFEKEGLKISDLSCFPTKAKQIEHLVSYTYFLREVRSDISMIELINSEGTKFGLKEYIQLMATETDWATLSAEEAAVENILRFGYMIKWIKGSIGDNIITDEKAIISELISCTSKEILKQKYLNLLQYLDKYEEEIAKINRDVLKELDQLVETWSCDEYLLKIKKAPFWKSFLQLYHHKEKKQSKYDFHDAEYDFGIKHILMNLPYYRMFL